jgi:hypothetical protein
MEMTMDGELLLEFLDRPEVTGSLIWWDDDDHDPMKELCVQEIITLENGTKNVEKWKRFVILPAKIGQKVR